MTAVASPPQPLLQPSVPPTDAPAAAGVEPDDLLGMDGLFELVDGHLREKRMGFDAGETTVNLTLSLGGHVKAHRLGKVVSKVTFGCFPAEPAQVRRPDVAFVAAARLADVPGRGHVPVRPDLAVEVLSPEDGVYELDAKLADYQSAGIPLVWVFNPEQRTVRVYHPDGSARLLTAADTLDGGGVLPGFAAVVGNLFPPPAPPPPPAQP